MKPLILPKTYNYTGIFLTFGCNLKCSYCINRFEQKLIKRKLISGSDWVRGLNRIEAASDLPLTLQGGEPSLHPDFIYIINNVKPELNIDILTNLQFDVEEFIANVDPSRIRRKAPYASIRASYHPEQMTLDEVTTKTKILLDKGFSIGIWSTLHPGFENHIKKAQEKCTKLGIDFRFKEFLGEFDEKLHGTYKYAGACEKKFLKNVKCKTTELLIDCTGDVYRCHSDLYAARKPVGNILDPDFTINDIFRDCDHFGYCNPCDVKIKTNRFQVFGHTSVEIKY